MRTLIAEDDATSRLLLEGYLSPYGECHAAQNGREAVEAFREARRRGRGYDLICMDIMMPEMDGHETLECIRNIEQERGIWGLDAVKVVMITALGDFENVRKSFRGQCDAYLVKPIRRNKILSAVRDLGFDVP